MIRLLSRFSLVGIMATSTYVVGATALIWLGVPALTASLVSYLAGVVVSLFGQMKFTFRVERPTPGNYVKFIVLSSTGLAFAQGVILTFSLMGWPPILAVAANCALIPAATFLAGRFWVFSNGRFD